MAQRSRLTLFLVILLSLTAAGILLQRGCDGVLAVEEWAPSIRNAAREAGLRDSFLLAGLVYAESRGRPAAVSSLGAVGLCQLMPATAAEVARRHRVEGSLSDPRTNLRLGALYLRELLDRWGGRIELALLSYRLGPRRVQDEIDSAGGADLWLARLQARKPSPWDYVLQVFRFRDRFRERGQAGVAWRASPPPSGSEPPPW